MRYSSFLLGVASSCFCLLGLASGRLLAQASSSFGEGHGAAVVSQMKSFVDSYRKSQNIPEPGTAWNPPNGAAPPWLESAAGDSEANEHLLNQLSTKVECEYNGLPLAQIMASLSDDLNIPIWINTPELDLLGVDSDTPITLRLPPTSLRSALRLMLSPLELTYIVRNSVLEITSKDSADSDPIIAYYDLSWVLDRSDYAGPLVSAIENTIEPDTWMTNGGMSTIHCVGKVMIVAASNTTQDKVRSMLSNLRKFRGTDATEKPKVTKVSAYSDAKK